MYTTLFLTIALAALLVIMALESVAVARRQLLFSAQLPVVFRGPLLGEAPRGRLAGATVAPGAAVTTASQVMPLSWSTTAYVYTINVTVGASTVTAVLDTGSAKFIVATDDCAPCSGARYEPAKSSTSVLILDPRKTEGKSVPATVTTANAAEYTTLLCTLQSSYVSQTDSIRMYQDTVTLARTGISPPSLCNAPVDTVLNGGSATTPLSITNFPVGGIFASTGTTSLNVMGMSGVQAATKTTLNGQELYIMPSCQTTTQPVYESAVIESLAMYAATAGTDVVWSHLFGTATGCLLFGALRLPCLSIQYVPMVATLPNATSTLVSTPYRYYAVPVQSIRAGRDEASLQPVAGAPKYMLVDTGTTQVLTPGSISDDLNSNAVVVITLGSGSQTATLTYQTPQSKTYAGGLQYIFADMPGSTAAIFSTAQDVGILGCCAMRNYYVEYNLTSHVIGFARMHG